MAKKLNFNEWYEKQERKDRRRQAWLHRKTAVFRWFTRWFKVLNEPNEMAFLTPVLGFHWSDGGFDPRTLGNWWGYSICTFPAFRKRDPGRMMGKVVTRWVSDGNGAPRLTLAESACSVHRLDD